MRTKFKSTITSMAKRATKFVPGKVKNVVKDIKMRNKLFIY